MPMTEAQFTETVVQIAKLHGWHVTHFRPGWSRGRWSTPLSGDPGFPDLCLARKGRVIFAELKSMTGKTSRAQDAWHAAIQGEPGGEQGLPVYLWRPSDLEQIKEVLR